MELDTPSARGAKIRVVGVGGGGGNAVNSMIDKGLVGVDFVAINTDVQALERSKSTQKIQIGKNLTRGLGAGADPNVGFRAVEEDREEIAQSMAGCDMVFITAGMGGGTGTGGAPVVASIAKSLGALVVGIVTRPFLSEGKKRASQAEVGLEELKKQVDTLIVIPNQKLLEIIDRKTTVGQAFEICNDVLYKATRGISEIITVPGLINVDFADVRRVMREMGDALMGTGGARGDNRAIEAANSAISSPLLEGVSIAGAQGILINITGGSNLAMWEVEESMSVIHQAAGDEAEIIFGTVIDDKIEEEMYVTVVATGFNKKAMGAKPVVRPSANLINRVPSGPTQLQQFDEPTFMRRGVELPLNPFKEVAKEEKIDKTDSDKPAFLRKIMD
ncbi:MAG: cell division protein FtsZ [Ignavibacteria bacterium GWA2_55_11]|nr:MAG: cell division protein FtsZ [Ignavibacteria bacterium GWA2_55_11]OGU68499.1 MAG: cell division protein FtsZ [Ignavibacteria bacterium RIFCSPHIGHO2_02_FULL_56_12]OGU72590.1 MAG: cell division protein FtsZ [Ignavibacteria bacterium RIFCSPLOWO2_02_FULL_55_14]HAV23927.1 cell division protein FtsZ [Bacteroidota bacterium]